MATQRISILGPEQGAPARKAAGSLRLPPTMNNDVFLNALLEMPTTQQTRRSPLKWLSAMGFHIVIVAALIIVPLYTTGTIHLNEYHEISVVAPPPPLAPPPAPAGGDRKSTRLNSSHQIISYAVFCLKKKHARDERELTLDILA